MPYDEIAKKVFETAKKKYRGASRKSDNKSYSDEAMAKIANLPGVKEARKLRIASLDATKEAHNRQGAILGVAYGDDTTGRDPSVVHGEVLYKMEQPTLNCSELAKIACFLAWEKNCKAVLASLGGFDHELCIVGYSAQEVETFLTPWKLSELSKQGAREAWAVDVWLNVCCRVDLYGDQAAVRLDCWAGKGKRIGWVPPGKEEDCWDSPGGAYKEAFLAASLCA